LKSILRWIARSRARTMLLPSTGRASADGAAIRHVEAALGTGIKSPAPCELLNISVARKSVVAARALPAGHQLAIGDLDIKRPGNGLAPKLLPALIGRTLRAGLVKDEIITWDHLA